MLSGNRLGGVGATHEPAGDRLDIGIDSVNAPLHAIQPLVDLLKPFVDLLKPFVDLLEALIHLFKPPVNLRKSIGDNGRKGNKPHIDGFKLCVKCLADQTHHEREVSQQHGKHAANGCPRLGVGHTTSLSPGTDI